jgi:hypothetical protein
MHVRRLLRLMRPRRIRRFLKDTRRLRRKERRWTGPRRPTLWQHGFLSESAAIYDFDRHGVDAYLSDYARFVLTPKIDPPRLRTVLVNKLAFHDRLDAEGFGDAKAPLLGVVSDGRFHPTSQGCSDLMSLLDREESVVLKPIAEGGGRGIKLVQRDSLGGLYVNGRPVSRKQLRRTVLTRSPSLIEGRLAQHQYAADIYPQTTNTIRLLVMHEVPTRDPFIALAVHRFGTDRSYPVDNWTRGGLSCHVDLASGRLGPGVTFPQPPPISWHDVHPNSGATLAGETIPDWHATTELVLTLSARLSFLPYIGWDVVVTGAGPKVIEGNYYSDVNLLQVHRPLLLDPRVRRFYKHHQVIHGKRN